MTPRLHLRYLSLILGIALGIRLTLAVVHGFWFPDSADYHNLAKSLVETGTYSLPQPPAKPEPTLETTPSPPATAGAEQLAPATRSATNFANPSPIFATRMPGYPLFIAAVYKTIGVPQGDPRTLTQPALFTVLVLQAFMGIAIIWLTYRLARRFSPAAGVLAAAMVAIDPLTIGFGASLLTETPFTLLMLVGISLVARAKTGWGTWIAFGIVWGLAVYFRASALWCIIPLALWAVLSAKGVSRSLPDGRGSDSGRLTTRLMPAAVAIALVWAMAMAAPISEAMRRPVRRMGDMIFSGWKSIRARLPQG